MELKVNNKSSEGTFSQAHQNFERYRAQQAVFSLILALQTCSLIIEYLFTYYSASVPKMMALNLVIQRGTWCRFSCKLP